MAKGPFKMKNTVLKMGAKSGTPMQKNFGKKLIKKAGHYASGLISSVGGFAHAVPAAISSLVSKDSSKDYLTKKHKEIRQHSTDHFEKGSKIKLFKK